MTITEAPTRLEALQIELGNWNATTIYLDDAEVDVSIVDEEGVITLSIATRDVDNGNAAQRASGGKILVDVGVDLTPEQAMKLAGRLTDYADEMSVADPVAVEMLRQAVEDVPGWTIEGLHDGISRSQVRCAAFKLGEQLADARREMP